MIPVAEVQFFDVVLFFHILAVVIGFGPTFAYSAFIAIAGKDGGRAVPSVSRGIEFWDKTIVTPASLLVLATGIYMVADTPAFELSDFFVSWGIAAVIVLLGVTHGIMLPALRRSIEVAEREVKAAPGDGPVEFSAEYEGHVKKLQTWGPLLGLIVILTIYFMTAQPFQ